MAAAKRKASVVEAPKSTRNTNLPPLKRRTSSRKPSTRPGVVDFDVHNQIYGGPNVTDAFPDSAIDGVAGPGALRENETHPENPLSDAANAERPKNGLEPKLAEIEKDAEEIGTGNITRVAKGRMKKPEQGRDDAATRPTTAAPTKRTKNNADEELDDQNIEADQEEDGIEVEEALARPPPVNSDFLPLPWKGRLGYACLNTYLRQSNPPVFSSRTCRIQSILEHRHPLQDTTQLEHPTKNKPDRRKPADVELGKRYLENICLANVRDIAKMIKWNDRYNIKFMRLSSEMFPFASHPEYGYKLAPFAARALGEIGEIIAQYGHRVTTHPGQFTQLGSPRKQVIDNAIRDLEYHDEMLTLLNLPEQQDKDAVMILHMGGIFDGKEATLARFKENYSTLTPSIKNRLVLENDDMGWSVHDLLPVCEELNIPLVLDFHHHNIVFDSSQLREGTKDIVDLFPRIAATWTKKGIGQKMHYSEPTPAAITPRQRRKHNPRVMTLPPCPPEMDLMIEAKDKEQAVFELMRTFKLPGYDTFTDILPYTRNDDNKAALAAMKRSGKNKNANVGSELALIPEEDVGMGGLEGRVYWPPGMDEWLRPKKREVKKQAPADVRGKTTKEQIKKEVEEPYTDDAIAEKSEEGESEGDATPATKKAKAAMRKKDKADKAKAEKKEAGRMGKKPGKVTKTAEWSRRKQTKARKKEANVPTPSASEDDGEEFEIDSDAQEEPVTLVQKTTGVRRTIGRKAKAKTVTYAEDEDEEVTA